MADITLLHKISNANQVTTPSVTLMHLEVGEWYATALALSMYSTAEAAGR